MEVSLISAGAVALAEIGDETQLLAFVLAAKLRKAAPIILGILVATLINHGFAGALGAWISAAMPAGTLRLVLGISAAHYETVAAVVLGTTFGMLIATVISWRALSADTHVMTGEFRFTVNSGQATSHSGHHLRTARLSGR